MNNKINEINFAPYPDPGSFAMFMEDWEIEELVARLMGILERRKSNRRGD